VAGPPGTRPPTLVRRAAAVRWTPPAATGHAASGPASPAPARAATATVTAVAERPAPSAPSGEPAMQVDAVGAAEPAAPEPRPTAQTPEEIGAPPATAPAPSAPAAATSAPAAAPAAASHGASAALDQETFDRVLEEQLAKGVDRRVAEGRARAAAVVAARKKSQG